MTRKSSVGVAVCVIELNGVAPSEIQLTPTGLFKSRDGRPAGLPGWYIDAAIAANAIVRTNTNVNKHVIDYEHQTLYTRENGKPAPAAGWYRRIEWREGQGLFGMEVEWTAAARQAITNKEYLYISPVIIYDRETGHVLGILMAALTNYPAIDGMAELDQLAAAHFSINVNQETNAMNKALLKILGLEEGASEEQIARATAALAVKIQAYDDSQTTIATLTAKVNEQAVALKAAGKDPDPAKYVPVETMTELRNQVAELTTRLNTQEVDDLVDVAMSDGKLLPSQEAWARKLGEKDIAELKAYLENAQPIAALKGSQTKGEGRGGEGGDGELTTEELAVCKSTGIDPEDYKKNKAAA